MKTRHRALASGIAVAALGFATPGVADAAISVNGATGPITFPSYAICRNKPAYGGKLQLEVGIPTVYARNYRAGGGNSYQPVRYMGFVQNVNNGAMVWHTYFTPWVTAYDNRPAALPAVDVMIVDNGNYRAGIYVQFAYNNQLSGEAFWTSERYYYYNAYQAGPTGIFATCARWS